MRPVGGFGVDGESPSSARACESTMARISVPWPTSMFETTAPIDAASPARWTKLARMDASDLVVDLT